MGSACGELDAVDPTYKFEGRIDEYALDEIKNHTTHGSILIINSTGGKIESAIQLGEYIHHYNLEVIIDGPCISACAEFILPAASKLTLTKDTMIGFHGNQYIFNDLYKRFDSNMRFHCYSELSRKADQLYSKLNVDKDFWLETYKRIEPVGVQIIENGSDCGALKYKLTHKFWYPSVDQIEGFLNREISDEICNNNGKCMGLYVLQNFRKSGQRYLIHDKSVEY